VAKNHGPLIRLFEEQDESLEPPRAELL